MRPRLERTVPNLIDGSERVGGAQTLPVIDPSSAETVAELAVAERATVDAAVSAARRRFEAGDWSRAPIEQRQSVLYAAAEKLRTQAERLGRLDTLCSGLPLYGSTIRQIQMGAGWLQYFAERIGSFGGQTFNQQPATLSLVLHEPRGVAGLFAPWNVPVGLGMLKAAAALAAGNSVVMKPSEQTPLATLEAARLLHEAGLPDGVLNVVNGPGPTTGAALAAHPGLDCISFTGGGAAGRAILEAAAPRYLPVTLELGGKSAFVVFDDADFERALDAALLGIFGNNGQACLAGSRILVAESIAERFIDAFVARARALRIGDPVAPETEMGPIASEGHMNRILSFIDAAVEDGDTVLLGEGRLPELGPGFYIAPIVARTNDPYSRIAQHEIFGPFATFMTFADEGDAWRLANATPYGLVAYLWTAAHDRVQRGMKAMRAGTVLINSGMVRERNAPFGGIGNSGLLSEGGDYSLRFYTQEKTVVMPENWQPPVRMGKHD